MKLFLDRFHFVPHSSFITKPQLITNQTRATTTDMETPYTLPHDRPLTRDQIKQNFFLHGVPVASWAKANGYTPRYVYMVLNGQFKGHFGKAHEIAVRLGLKLNPENLERLAA